MSDEQKRDAVAEPGMQGFVVPAFHADPGTESPTQESHGQQSRFRDTSSGMTRLPLVHAEQEKGERIDKRKTEYDEIQQTLPHYISSLKSKTFVPNRSERHDSRKTE